MSNIIIAERIFFWLMLFWTSKVHRGSRRLKKILLIILPVSLFPLQLAEYRQRKAYADSQKKQKKKKKKKAVEGSEGDLQGRVEDEPDRSFGGEESSGGAQDGSQEGNKDPPTTEFTFTKTLRSGETVKHDQTYTIEVDT